MQGVTVAIPTIGRVETLPVVITAVAFQEEPVEELIILDEAKTPIMESYAVNQALDVLSIQWGTNIKILRNRRRGGIGAARLRLVKEASNPRVLMIDDDVVLRPTCLRVLDVTMTEQETPWVVPCCVLVPAGLELDGYIDHLVDPESPEVMAWTERYPWFVPYFRYSKPWLKLIPVSGTQAILVEKKAMLKKAGDIGKLGNLPREDTYMTSMMGTGAFISRAECLHYEHPSQIDRGNWGQSMFYRLHEAIIADPKGFMALMYRR